jgi:mRNA-degrading endonuclease RelE of RelBE toxin-antitoxin system
MAKRKNNRYQIFIRNKAKKSLLKIPLFWREKIEKAIDLLEEDPFYGEKMWGRLKEQRKIRIWPYRIIYRIYKDQKIIYIERIDHRGSIGYK